MDQPGIEIRPIRQITGTAEFNEVFFDGARTRADLCVGAPGDGWKVAMGTLAFERGVLTLGQQMAFERELDRDHRRRPASAGVTGDPVMRQRLAGHVEPAADHALERAARPAGRRERARCPARR